MGEGRNRPMPQGIRLAGRCSTILHPNLHPQGACCARGILGEGRKREKKGLAKGEVWLRGILGTSRGTWEGARCEQSVTCPVQKSGFQTAKNSGNPVGKRACGFFKSVHPRTPSVPVYYNRGGKRRRDFRKIGFLKEISGKFAYISIYIPRKRGAADSAGKPQKDTVHNH